ncbi:hypothetical protein [Rhodobacter maris]|nr:hypothetical protein [Rhodobacter maris]
MKIVRSPQIEPAAIQAIARGGLSGIGPCDALWDGDRLLLATSSLTLHGRLYDAAIEVMTSQDGGATFLPPHTLLTSAANNGYPVTLPCIRKLAGGGWRMWFTAFTQWVPEAQPKPDARYCIRSARSEDAEFWTVDPSPAILRAPGEAGLARPTVLEGSGGFEMWFSARGPYSQADPGLRRYRLGYARSRDGAQWRREDERQGFCSSPAPDDWDGQMQCYPFVLRLTDGRQVMFYCGNGYGEAGFGWATREPEGWNQKDDGRGDQDE